MMMMNGHNNNNNNDNPVTTTTSTNNGIVVATNNGVVTTSTANANANNSTTVKENKTSTTTSKDERWITNSEASSWFSEPHIATATTASSNTTNNEDGTEGTSVLSSEGLTNIAEHAYQAGECTILDNLINPIWQYLTDNILPIWMAPNLVTVIGLSFTMLSYCISWYYNPNLATTTNSSSSTGDDGNTGSIVVVPDEILILNGICLIIYYTLDCMDGKQARRTQSSSPLGQLLDHGVDCIANIPFSNLVQCVLRLNGLSYIIFQLTLQMGFYQAQWEEYCTSKFQHSVGGLFGVTEVVYGLAVWSIITGLSGLFDFGTMDKSFYDEEFTLLGKSTLQLIFPGSSLLIDYSKEEIPKIKDIIVLVWSWGYIMMLSPLSILRVSKLVKSWSRLGECLTKMISPTVLSITAIYWSLISLDDSSNNKSSTSSSSSSFRLPSIVIGLCFCLITNKLIVFGMAKQYYSAIQLDIVPAIVAIGLSLAFKQSQFAIYFDLILFGIATLFYLIRFMKWTTIAIHQLCQKLNIEVFRIKYTKQL